MVDNAVMVEVFSGRTDAAADPTDGRLELYEILASPAPVCLALFELRGHDHDPLTAEAVREAARERLDDLRRDYDQLVVLDQDLLALVMQTLAEPEVLASRVDGLCGVLGRSYQVGPVGVEVTVRSVIGVRQPQESPPVFIDRVVELLDPA
jgi:hypothetical protein